MDQAHSVTSAASGIFRGLLSNVGTSVSGVNTSASISALEHKIEQLSDELHVLQDELESKIQENEHLVMDNCETKREKREAEMKLADMRTEMDRLVDADRSMRAELDKILCEKNQIVEKLESSEIKIDGFRREVELQNEILLKFRTQNESLDSRLSIEASAKVCLELEVRDLKTNLVVTESKLDQCSRQLAESITERNDLQAKLLNEEAASAALKLRVAELEEESSIATLSVVSGVSTPTENDSLPRCDIGNPLPCCYRSEYFRDKYKNTEIALRATTARLKEVQFR